ncbi:MAG: hypothetical protein QGM50_11335 [Anaerolineae bacterium]|nr:hypothetical protein [Anaerolineae bacterium]
MMTKKRSTQQTVRDIRRATRFSPQLRPPELQAQFAWAGKPCHVFGF